MSPFQESAGGNCQDASILVEDFAVREKLLGACEGTTIWQLEKWINSPLETYIHVCNCWFGKNDQTYSWMCHTWDMNVTLEDWVKQQWMTIPLL